MLSIVGKRAKLYNLKGNFIGAAGYPHLVLELSSNLKDAAVTLFSRIVLQLRPASSLRP